MTANVNPVFPLTPNVAWGTATLTTANTAKDGTGTVQTVFTAGATGSFVDKIRFHAAGTNTASVGRIFINNGSTNATPANNSLFGDVSLPGTTNSEVASINTTGEIEVQLGFALPAGYKLNVTIGTTVAAGWAVTAFGGDY